MPRSKPGTWWFFAIILAGLVAPHLFFAEQRSAPKPPQPRPSPNAPNPNYPPGLEGPQAKGPDTKAIDRQNQAELRSEIEKLYALASELREEVNQTDGRSVLSLSVVKRAQQIEKLAKDIKDRAKH